MHSGKLSKIGSGVSSVRLAARENREGGRMGYMFLLGLPPHAAFIQGWMQAIWDTCALDAAHPSTDMPCVH